MKRIDWASTDRRISERKGQWSGGMIGCQLPWHSSPALCFGLLAEMGARYLMECHGTAEWDEVFTGPHVAEAYCRVFDVEIVYKEAEDDER